MCMHVEGLPEAWQRLREDASALKSGWDAQIAQLSKEMISKDLQLQSLQEEEVELKAHLARCQQDIGRYKQQLSAAAERERCLEREKTQLQLDWQQRCDGVERAHYRKSEDLIQALTEARDQVAAKLQETERTLRDQEVVLKALTLERDQAVQALRTQGLLPEKEVQMLLRHHEEEIRGSFPSSEIQRLQEQNTSLRRAVSEMRKEMETLSDLVLPAAPSGGQSSDTEQPRPSPEAATEAPDHVTVLETEIRNLKHKFKTLEEQVEDVLDPSKRPSSYTDFQPSVCTSAGVPGGAVSADGSPIGLALRRLRDRAHLTNFLVARLRRKLLQRPLDMDTVQHELPREVGQVHLEVSELRKQVAELEEHLGSRPQLQALDKVAPGKEVPADQGPTGAEDQGPQPPQALSVPQLQRKLKEAARKILRLCLEKEQLLEMGNRLRAELGHHAPEATQNLYSDLQINSAQRKPVPKATPSSRVPQGKWAPHRKLLISGQRSPPGHVEVTGPGIQPLWPHLPGRLCTSRVHGTSSSRQPRTPGQEPRGDTGSLCHRRDEDGSTGKGQAHQTLQGSPCKN
ncbi:coiled-coil domain-containing protein 57-like [Leptonychotes weddellii]|uniref:Coiled-coil domain-containing protein 57-like n=1 Tax=Leptonychotes weddellii TaxID=9713 RepID=A0A7F8RNI8_LEPWE|nr:coiled-coil domain-containing protein 57-like [Leptonychotes weddellii]